MSNPAAPPELAPWFDPWPSWIWWRPLLKLAHRRLVVSVGARETSGPAPSRDNVPKQTKQRWNQWIRYKGLKELFFVKEHYRPCSFMFMSLLYVFLFFLSGNVSMHECFTCCVLVPDFDGTVMGGRCYASCPIVSSRQEHTAGGCLEMPSVLHNLTARLTQVPQLSTQTQRHWEQVISPDNHTYITCMQVMYVWLQHITCMQVMYCLYNCLTTIHHIWLHTTTYCIQPTTTPSHKNGLTVASHPWPPKPLLLDTK